MIINNLSQYHHQILILTNVVMCAVVMDTSFVGEFVCMCVVLCSVVYMCVVLCICV